ncbi:hypothetical protein QE152_g8920 [Popillia japonica]|uniref:PHD-type domain-containing protein n=1 Tax=Popillia japonica TaxID=7064 RepID=A0AAW1M4C0_POPJA
MADESGDSAGSAKDNKDKLCDFCEYILRKGQKCVQCGVNCIHAKCLDAAVKAGNVIDRKFWKCKACIATSSPLESSTEEATIVLDDMEDKCDVRRENVMLKTQIGLLNKLIIELENVNKLQREKIEYLERHKTTTTPEEHTHQQTTYAYSDAMKEHIDPVNLSIAIDKVVSRKDGSIAIRCNDSSNLNKLKSSITDKMGNEFSATIPRRLNPKIVIYDVNTDDIVENDQFCDKLVV